jgi:hypothetical protein
LLPTLVDPVHACQRRLPIHPAENANAAGPARRRSHHLVSFDTIGGQTYAFTVTSQEKVLHALCEIKRSARFYRWNDEPEGYQQEDCK